MNNPNAENAGSFRHRSVRIADGRLLARGETEGVLVTAQTGRPCPIPASVSACLTFIPNHEL
ncbi:MAG: hypothetical protein WC708_08550 [Lentisphaeria bacterium]